MTGYAVFLSLAVVTAAHTPYRYPYQPTSTSSLISSFASPFLILSVISVMIGYAVFLSLAVVTAAPAIGSIPLAALAGWSFNIYRHNTLSTYYISTRPINAP